MEFFANNIYHIYNRGNNKNSIFLKEGNYIYFLQKVRKYILPHCDILAYVLMPNHFHFLIHADERTEKQMPEGSVSKNVLSEGIRLLLSSYTKGINKQENRTGNLIQQNTKSKCVYDTDNPYNTRYAATCFHYIHQNPLKAGFVNSIEEWKYSSFPDYAGLRNGTLCNKEMADNLLSISLNDAPLQLDGELLENIW
jgi:putative transposase